jgi:hypothetical protein
MDRYDLLVIGGGAAEHQRLKGATEGARRAREHEATERPLV